ncbi:MAG: 4-hydroxy-3-methylbut-2-enyl diphosphate reductase [Lachnospiraceae bacterium]|nr:4-hydroxy-3-methylbut-2-enyl diphosphate reductase [Lachnospiraceae bacterium]
MEVIVAKKSGFCFGVERAVNKVYEQIGKKGNIYTYGQITHNEQVVRDLAEKGVKVIEDRDALSRVTEGTIIIRAHGVERIIYEMIERQGLECVDATCPFVKRIHRIVQRESGAGCRIVIAGNPRHPEVEGIMGWCSTEPIVVETAEEAETCALFQEEKICLVSQTTFNYNKFEDIVEIFRGRYYNISIVNTICSATEERQAEAREIAASVDAMIVIGGKHSSNTRKLYEICSGECPYTYYIQTLDDLHLELPKSVRLVGITAGASTPSNIIEEVQNYVRINF